MERRRFRFGLFEFDAATRELRREGVVVRLQAQPAQVLACLIQSAGQVVSRDELRQAVWGGETFVDFDRGLNFCISQLRSALRDDSAQPTYIRTLPKQGYQFIAPAQPVVASARAPDAAPAAPRHDHARAVALVLALTVFAALALATGWWLRSRRIATHTPILAVLRFDNETGDPAMTRFSDALTDTLVEQLTSLSNGRYAVIGNARILRLPREQRDLNAIGSSLNASYVVLGQVQHQDDRTRILVHLIRLPGQTHIWVVRMERTMPDPMSLEAEAAQKVAAEFSRKVAADASGASPAAALR